MPPRIRPHTAGVVDLLEAAAIPVGRGIKPEDGGWQGEPGTSDFVGYVVLYPGGGQTQGIELSTLGDPHGSLLYSAQLTAIGATEEQAEDVLDKAREALVGVRVPVAGRVTQPAYTVPGFDVPTRRDDQVSPVEFYAITQFRFKSDPV